MTIVIAPFARHDLTQARRAHIKRFAARTSAISASGWLTMVANMMPLMMSDQAVSQ